MIKVPRGACPPSLSGEGSAGGKERARAIAHYADPVKAQKSFDFKAYKGADVIAALQSAFGVKCAYCESRYGAVGPADIEHYRPKGAIQLPDGTLQKRGYFWLAADWANLLPSCIDCNRARGHEYEDGSAVTGKANQFPLIDESRRAAGPGREGAEEPYLLDPTVDEPDEHLEFIDHGLVRGALLNGRESDRGSETIGVVGLRRPHLVDARRDRLLEVDRAVHRLVKAAKKLDADSSDSYARENLEEAIEELKAAIHPSAEYAAMARQRVRPILAQVGISIT
ncbi:MAG TPA: hypothetical protein VMR96_02700 [Solirubrobacterales bacterium]|nr:hypothetical protein [Solirubrobacterales bacterium]